MEWKNERKILIAIIAIFLGCFFLPIGIPRFDNALLEALHLVKWYAHGPVIMGLLPALLIAGAIAVFISKAAVMKYLGAHANKILAYGVASISGAVLAVCSCAILPLFAGIYKRGAGLGPATAFLYSGPAINVMAIVLTARVLGLEIGIARAVGAIGFSIVIGVLMHLFFRKEEQKKAQAGLQMPEEEVPRPLWQTAFYFAMMIAILVSVAWSQPTSHSGMWSTIYSFKWIMTSILAIVFGFIIVAWFRMKFWKMSVMAIGAAGLGIGFPHEPRIAFGLTLVGLSYFLSTSHQDELREWFSSSWDFAKQILPLFLFGVLIAGVLFGSPGREEIICGCSGPVPVGSEGVIPSAWINVAVGGNTVRANLFASVAGVFMYFATLTEVPILKGLMSNGMGKGPALALLLAGPALSLPNMLVIRSVLGTQKTLVYVLLVIVMATISGLIFGVF
jgi:uncharacterized membrane protein YraQ (UPF0718 family)